MVAKDDQDSEVFYLRDEPASKMRSGDTTGHAIRMNRKRLRLWLGVSLAVLLAGLLFYHIPYPLSGGADHIDAQGGFNNEGTQFNVSLYNGNDRVALEAIRIMIRMKIYCRRRNDWPVDSIFTRDRLYRHSFKQAVAPRSTRRFSFPVQAVISPYDNCQRPNYDSWWIEGGRIRLDLF